MRPDGKHLPQKIKYMVQVHLLCSALGPQGKSIELVSLLALLCSKGDDMVFSVGPRREWGQLLLLQYTNGKPKSTVVRVFTSKMKEKAQQDIQS
jgi:hypothetical protein